MLFHSLSIGNSAFCGGIMDFQLKEIPMPYRYPEARLLDTQPKVGNAECVTLIRHYKKISIRFIRKQRRNPDGTYANPSDNADAFWVIE